jgi:hypothetical protein
MAVQETSMRKAARYAVFSTIGLLCTAQEMMAAILEDIEGAEPELVAEETLGLVSIATTRAAEFSLREQPEIASALLPAMAELPFMYRDYLIGSALLSGEDEALVDSDRQVYERLKRKCEFYDVHLPRGQFPGERVLADKMALWMGRISPPGLPEKPVQRLERLELVPLLLTHLKMVLAFGRHDEPQ